MLTVWTFVAFQVKKVIIPFKSEVATTINFRPGTPPEELSFVFILFVHSFPDAIHEIFWTQIFLQKYDDKDMIGVAEALVRQNINIGGIRHLWRHCEGMEIFWWRNGEILMVVCWHAKCTFLGGSGGVPLPKWKFHLRDRNCWLFRCHTANIGLAVTGSARPVPPPLYEA